MRNLLLMTVAVVIITSCTSNKSDEEKNKEIVIGRKDVIHSNILNEDRPYWVYVPPYSVKSGKKFPVLYLLDGDAHFHSVSGLMQILGTGVNGTRLIPEMIIVAIPNTDRTRDLTPTHSEIIDGKTQEFLKTSGGGANFLKFLKEELIPDIEKKYPTVDYRMLVGHSFGGIAAINAMYTMPGVFQSFIAIDPSLWWDDHLLLKKADTAFGAYDYSKTHLYLSQANTLNPGELTNDHFGTIGAYHEKIESMEDMGLKWEFKYYGDDSHGSVPLISTYDGLRFIFKDYYPRYENVGEDPDWVKKVYEQFKVAPPERVVDGFANRAMSEGKLDLAHAYLKLNTEYYPVSSWAYRAMGHHWVARKDTVQAITNYKKALELDPSDETVKAAMDSLAKK
jgi:predicted alpha/beta superfamily hydrolase